MISYTATSDRIISARFQTRNGTVTICQVYAPTADADDNTIDAFYNDLQEEINKIPKRDALILMGDFNAKVGAGDENTRAVIGRYGIGQRNERGDRLLDFCYVNNLCITNTRFKQAKISRCWTWESPDRRTHNQIDYIIVSQKLIGSIRNSRAFPSADCGSDHQLVMANIRLKWKVRKPIMRAKKVDVQRLQSEDIRQKYHTEVEAKWQVTLTEPITSIEEEWNKVKDIIQNTSKEVVGYKKAHNEENG